MRRLALPLCACLLAAGCGPAPSSAPPTVANSQAPARPPFVPVPTPEAINPAAARRDAAAKEAAAKQEAEHLAALQAERDRQDSIVREEQVKQQRAKEAFGLLTTAEKTMATHIAQELADPTCQGVGGPDEYGLLQRQWGAIFYGDAARSGVARFARASHVAGGFNLFAAQAGFAASDADLTDAAIQWYFLGDQATALNAAQLCRQFGYDNMPAPPRQFMLDHPALFRPILKARGG